MVIDLQSLLTNFTFVFFIFYNFTLTFSMET